MTYSSMSLSDFHVSGSFGLGTMVSSHSKCTMVICLIVSVSFTKSITFILVNFLMLILILVFITGQISMASSNFEAKLNPNLLTRVQDWEAGVTFSSLSYISLDYLDNEEEEREEAIS